VASGAWHSDRGKINDHKRAQMFDIFCGRGYTVFAVRPGSISRFSLADMAVNVKKGITWVKDHAEQYKIDPNRLALCGASAGGHLASLVAVTADDKTAVKAVGVFFPPTDFLDFRGMKVNENSSEDALAAVSRFVLPPHTKTGNAAKMLETLKAVSPAHNVTSKAPPFLIIHGDKDPLVPLNQSERLLAALQANGVPAELIVKKGGAHPWPTIHEEVKVIADWLDKQLASK
jgi:acetyl esterase/lipase